MFQFTVDSLTFEQITSIVLLIFLPGIVFMYHLRLWIAMDKVRATDLIFASFLGFVNFTITVFVMTICAINIAYILFCLMVIPICAPLLWKKFSQSSFYKNHFVSFYDTAFDFAANACLLTPIIVIHLKNGKTVAGLFVDGVSFYSVTPNSGDIFLAIELEVKKDGTLVWEDNKPVTVPYSRGLLVRANEYSYIEVFDY